MNAPDIHNIRIFQKLGRVTVASVETCDQLLLILPSKPGAVHFKALPQGSKLQQVLRKSPTGANPALLTRMTNKRQTLVVGGTLSKDATAFERLTLGRKLVREATRPKAGSLGICVVGFDKAETQLIYNDMIAAALAAAFEMTIFKSLKYPPVIRSISLLGLD